MTLNSSSDLKVSEGDFVSEGDVISDRSLLRQELQTKKKQLELAIKKESLNVPKLINPLPAPNYYEELAAVSKAKIELELSKNTPQPNFRFTSPELRAIHEASLVKEKANLDREIVRASSNYNQALAKLNAAKSEYQHKQYLHSLEVNRYEALQQQHEYELESLRQQLGDVERELEELVLVRTACSSASLTPHSGRVKRIKILGQSDRTITAEVMLDIRK